MRQGGYDLAKYPRDPSKDACAIYKYDRVKLWLLRDERNFHDQKKITASVAETAS